MKTIKIKFVGFWSNYSPETLYIYRALKKYYNVEITDDPDYIICSCFGEPYEYCQYPQVRIMCVGENYIPDFNLIDYAISMYPIEFLDRNFYMPISMDSIPHVLELEEKQRDYDEKFLSSKKYFANFIAGHESENGARGAFFKQLCEYKRVESPGKYLNNMPNGEIVGRVDDEKIEFQKQCKFTLCFESTKSEGFITEKIVDAFYSDTIPIYYGSSTVSNIFNPDAFIDVSKFASIEEAIEYVKKVDNDADLYLHIMNQPILCKANYFSDMFDREEMFIKNIFEQPLEQAYRRSRWYLPMQMDEYLNNIRQEAYLCSKISTTHMIKESKKRMINHIKRKTIGGIFS